VPTAAAILEAEMLVNVEDFRDAARRRLPRIAFDAIDGGSADEATLRRNRSAFEEILLRPGVMADVRERDISTSVLGQRISMPLLVGPAGFARMGHREGELAAARAAADAETIYALSTVSSYELEDVARASKGPKWFQLYPPGDRDACASLLQRAHDAGYEALAVTVDTAVEGLRERDRRHRLAVPLRMTPRLMMQGATRPRWAFDYLRGGAGRGAQGIGAAFLQERGTRPEPRSLRDAGRAIAATARSITEEEIRFIRDTWKRPLLIKGVMRAEECKRLIALGADGIVVSNHGGRQLDGVLATIEALPEIVGAVEGKLEVFVDGGFRRGTDVVKALALGARACLVGRPYLYGLAVGGQAGVRHVLEIFRTEIDQTMALLGCATVADLDESAIQLLGGFAGRPRARAGTRHAPNGQP
jgi:isopentenyl diphosphate isomerase/L-lactate dehydrogenase-like FMN-dependent dehydrogenase